MQKSDERSFLICVHKIINSNKYFTKKLKNISFNEYLLFLRDIMKK